MVIESKMAESLFAALAKTIVKEVGSEVWKTIVGAADIDSQIKGLQDIKTTLEAVLLDADSSEVCSHSQRDVLEKLDCVLAKLIDFQDAKDAKAKQKELMGGSKGIKEARLFFSGSNQLVTPFKDAKKIKGITEELSRIAANHAQFRNMISPSTSNQTRTLSNESDSYMCNKMVVGRDGDRDHMVSMLLLNPHSGGDGHISVASMVGIGGIGKTTLAKYVFHDQRVVMYFDMRLWASTTQDFDVKDLLRQIVGVGGPTDDGRRVDCTIRELLDRLLGAVAGKRFLLVLDGVWDTDLLRARFGDLKGWLRVGAQGSQILLTTRSDTVAKMIGTQDPYMVGDLGDDDSWLLFKRYAITQWHESGVEAVGRKIVKMCHNVPLVIQAIGSLLARKFTVREWSTFWNDDFSKFVSYGRSVIDTLKASYDHLNRNLQLCVAYCSLFPKEFLFEKSYLIHLWIAMGYVKVEYTNQSIEDAAEDYVSCLLERGFFQCNETDFGYMPTICFQMHNLMHDLVFSIAGFKYKMADSNTNEFDERVCHVSFESVPNSSWKVLPSLFKIKRLESILLPLPESYPRECEKARVIATYDESTFKSLRVLRMHGVGMSEMPSSIGKLIHLRYLDFSNNPIRKLTGSITKIVHLYLLDLSYCRELEELPEDINKVASLTHLILKGCSGLRYMPKKLAMLADLETVSRFVVGKPSGSKADLACNLADLSCFQNLKGHLTVVLRNSSSDTISKTQVINLSMEKITDIRVECNGSLIQNLKACPHLTHLKIRNYAGKSFPLWMREGIHSGFPNLVEIRIIGCQECLYVASFGGLPHLKYLVLVNLGKVEYIENGDNCGNNNGNTMVLASIHLFPSLINLRLTEIPKLKGWWSVIDSAQDERLNNKPIVFPKLERMTMDRELLITLAKVFLPTISSLQDLYVYRVESGQTCCPSSNVILLKNYFPMLRQLYFDDNQMRVLPEQFRAMSSLESLKINDGEAFEAVPEWIDSLTSLNSLTIDNCPSLKSLPHEISNLSNLTLLQLYRCSWELAERCQAPLGEDWPKIQHIPNIVIEPAKNDEESR